MLLDPTSRGGGVVCSIVNGIINESQSQGNVLLVDSTNVCDQSQKINICDRSRLNYTYFSSCLKTYDTYILCEDV